MTPNVRSRENLVIAAFVVVALPVAYAVRALADGAVGEDAAFALSFAALLLVGVGGPSVYRRFSAASSA